MTALAYSRFPILNVLGTVVAIFALSMLAPLLVALAGSDAALKAYDEPLLITLICGTLLWFVARRFKRPLQPRNGFLLVTLVGTVVPAFATLPLLFHLPRLPFTAIAASLNNTGPGLNQVGPATNYAGLTDIETWVCTFAKLIGRLELMSVLVLFTPAFWRK